MRFTWANCSIFSDFFLFFDLHKVGHPLDFPLKSWKHHQSLPFKYVINDLCTKNRLFDNPIFHQTNSEVLEVCTNSKWHVFHCGLHSVCYSILMRIQPLATKLIPLWLLHVWWRVRILLDLLVTHSVQPSVCGWMQWTLPFLCLACSLVHTSCVGELQGLDPTGSFQASHAT